MGPGGLLRQAPACPGQDAEQACPQSALAQGAPVVPLPRGEEGPLGSGAGHSWGIVGRASCPGRGLPRAVPAAELVVGCSAALFPDTGPPALQRGTAWGGAATPPRGGSFPGPLKLRAPCKPQREASPPVPAAPPPCPEPACPSAPPLRSCLGTAGCRRGGFLASSAVNSGSLGLGGWAGCGGLSSQPSEPRPEQPGHPQGIPRVVSAFMSQGEPQPSSWAHGGPLAEPRALLALPLPTDSQAGTRCAQGTQGRRAVPCPPPGETARGSLLWVPGSPGHPVVTGLRAGWVSGRRVRSRGSHVLRP